MTYPDNQVAELLNQRFIPVQVDIQKASKLVDRYLALWTPNLNVIDSRGQIVYKEIGWLPPDDFAAMLRLGEGHYRLHRKKYEDATPLFEEVLDRHAKSLYAAEALYYRGVSRYMASHEVSALTEDWGELQRRFSGSAWAVKADVM